MKRFSPLFFREECEELRSIVSHRQRDELFKERQTQLAEKAAQQQQENEIKQMYAELWEQDRLAKAQKEELEAQEQIKRNREMVEVSMGMKYIDYDFFHSIKLPAA